MKNHLHWNIQKRQWTSHTYKYCSHASTILVLGEWRTEVKPKKKDNPRGWVFCDHTQVVLNPVSEVLSLFRKVERLTYDKTNMVFNITKGYDLLFDEDGCFIIERIG